MLGISLAAMDKRLSRAKKMLREALGNLIEGHVFPEVGGDIEGPKEKTRADADEDRRGRKRGPAEGSKTVEDS